MAFYPDCHGNVLSDAHSDVLEVGPAISPYMKRWALSYAQKGIAVFPCKVSDKAPLTGKGGFHLATTDPEQIEKWWNRYPDASIGAPTGLVNGWGVADLDEDTHEALNLWYSLPETLTAKTGRASGKGRHAYFTVDKPTPSRKLAGGAIDLKADGGYIILPPSGHASGNRYEWLHRSPVAPLPEDLLTDEQEDVRHNGHRGQRRYTDDGGPILKGERDDALASIAGRLRAMGLEQGEILEELIAVNEERCQPPKKPSALRRIARSIATRYPAGNMPRGDARTHAPLDAARGEWWRSEWENKSDRDLLHVILKEGYKHGKLLPCGGVDVSISYRELAVKAAISLKTARKGVARLIEAKWLRKGKKGEGTKSGSLVVPPRAGVPHSDHHRGSGIEDVASVVHLRAPRLRHSATLPVMRKGRRIDTIVILRLGKTCGAIIDLLEAHGQSANVEEIGDALHVKRVRDLKRRNIARLEERGIVKVEGDTVTLVDDWMEALETERSITGEKFAEAYWRKRYKEQQDAYRGKHKVKAHRFSMAEMWDRLPRPTSELTRLPDPHPELVTVFRLWAESRPLALKDYPSRIAATVWAYDLVSFKPTAPQVESALYEVLGAKAA